MYILLCFLSKWEGAAYEDGKKPSVWDTFLHSRKHFFAHWLLFQIRLLTFNLQFSNYFLN